MNCSFCGEICRCDAEPPPSVLALSEPDRESTGAAATPVLPCGPVTTGADDPSAWRDELSLRLNRYRARRKMRPPRYPSLNLPFDAMESSGGNPGRFAAPPSFSAPYSDRALALDRVLEDPFPPDPQAEPAGESEPESVALPEPSTRTAKIIEFPRLAWGPPPPPLDQLAEPVSTRPRILEAPELIPPPPALGGITIEAVERQPMEKRPGIDIPLQSASLPRRALASLVDGMIVALASGLFGFIFWKIVAVRPPLLQILALAAGIPCLLGACYQYLLIVYAAATPGLRAAGLELTGFDGSSTRRSLRRWRVLAACLSAVSLGMGYVWVFLDEDALCWHDRITHTYLAPVKPRAQPGL
jgi:uncharacterized RDD family membrane protein YckC